MSVILAVKNWERFQHYKDRDPPWVKLYRDLLTSESWVLGTDLSRVVQVASTLLAPRYNNQIPYRFDLLKRVMSLDCSESAFKKAIDYLVEAKFLEIHDVTNEAKDVAQSASTTLATCPSEGDQKEIREEKKQNGNHAVVPTDVELVFDHWRKTHNHLGAKLDDKRQKVIRVALKAYSPEQLCVAITGYKNSPFHMGQNERKTVYTSLGLLLRDGDQIDKGIALANKNDGVYTNSI